MKRIMITLAIVVLTAISLFPAGIYYRTSCGEVGMTVGRDFFESDADFENYLRLLNSVSCNGDNSMPEWSENPFPDEKPAPAD